MIGGIPASPGNRQYVFQPAGSVISIAADSRPSSPTPAASSRIFAFDPLDQSLIAATAGTARSTAAVAIRAAESETRWRMSGAYRGEDEQATTVSSRLFICP